MSLGLAPWGSAGHPEHSPALHTVYLERAAHFRTAYKMDKNAEMQKMCINKIKPVAEKIVLYVYKYLN